MFLDTNILNELRSQENARFDVRKLVRFCEELNDACQRGNYLSAALLIRAVMNHIPAVFGAKTFGEVVAQSGRSLKSVLSIMQDGARPVADLHTHALIRSREALPTKHQVDPYKAGFELLIQEVIVKIKP
ncbi:MAG: hypothetical protein AAGM45_21450 [Cyanobacteria bacterium J06588_5]